MIFKKGFKGVWSDFPMSPTECVVRVIKGELKVVGRDEFRRRVYEVIKEFETAGGKDGE